MNKVYFIIQYNKLGLYNNAFSLYHKESYILYQGNKTDKRKYDITEYSMNIYKLLENKVPARGYIGIHYDNN